MTSLVAAEQSQNFCLKLVWVIPTNKKYTEGTHVIKIATFDLRAVMIVVQRLHTINYKTSALARVCNDVNSEITRILKDCI